MTDLFPDGFFRRADEFDDRVFYRPPRLVTHIDEGAVAGVGRLYARLALGPSVLDVCSSWVTHFADPPAWLTALGMNADELAANPAATERVVQDLNRDPEMPFGNGTFDDATCCVSVDYLTRPVDVFAEVRRVLRPGGRFVCTWSNRCFPTKAIHGWLVTPEADRPAIVAGYFQACGGWDEVVAEVVIPPGSGGDPLWAVWGTR